jgi:hypothetical protein
MDAFEPEGVEPGRDLERWEAEMWSILIPLQASLKTAYWLSTPEAALATSDQFRAIARDSSRWVLDHHCPAPDLAVAFTRVLRSSVALADVLAVQGQHANGVNWPAITREVNGFHALLEQFLTMLRERSTRTPSDPWE